MKNRTYYLHTLDGKPAGFFGDQVCFAPHYGHPARLVETLKQIRKEQKASRIWREEQGFKGYSGYGYVRVSVPGGKDD